MENIHTRIKELRLTKGMSLSEFAGSIGCSKTMASYIESGRRAVSHEILRSIVQTHSVNEEWLTGGRGEMFDQESVALKELYGKLTAVTQQYPGLCRYFGKFLIYERFEQADRADKANEKIVIFDIFPNLTKDKFMKSEAEPRELILALARFYGDIEALLSKCIRLICMLKKSSGLAEFYHRDRSRAALVDKPEAELIRLRDTVAVNRRILEKNTDNNVLLDIEREYRRIRESLSYRENLAVVEFAESLIRRRTA